MKKHLFFLLVFLCPLIVYSQNVGVGTTTPLKKLHIQSGGTPLLTSAYGDGMLFSTNSNSGARIFLENLNGDIGQKTIALVNETVIGGQGGTTYFGSLSDDGSAWIQKGILSMIHSSGNVGIGQLYPGAKLDVNGNLKVAGIISGVSDPLSAQDAATKAYVDLNTTETQTLSSVVALGNSANSQLKNVTDPTDAQDAATKAYVDLLEAQILELQLEIGIKVQDNDGNIYSTVKIGDQKWMAENLNIGIMIAGSGDQADNATIEKYCYDDIPANCDIYGGLYQWEEVMQYTTTESSQGICPTGWHLPSDDEIKTLEMTLGMTQAEADMTGYRGTDQGSQLAGNEPLWNNGLLDQNAAFGSSGFARLPGGFRDYNGGFYNKSWDGRFWSSSQSGSTAWYRYWFYNNIKVYREADPKHQGFSVRCVQDD